MPNQFLINSNVSMQRYKMDSISLMPFWNSEEIDYGSHIACNIVEAPTWTSMIKSSMVKIGRAALGITGRISFHRLRKVPIEHEISCR